MISLAQLIKEQPPKRSCNDRDKQCPATQYLTPVGWLCVCCDHEMFEICWDCGRLRAWCSCANGETEECGN